MGLKEVFPLTKSISPKWYRNKQKIVSPKQDDTQAFWLNYKNMHWTGKFEAGLQNASRPEQSDVVGGETSVNTVTR